MLNRYFRITPIKLILFASTIILSITPTKGQHCPWDGTYIIILDIRDEVTGKIIDGLDIILTESTKKPYLSNWNLQHGKGLTIHRNTDTLKFGQNLEKQSKDFSINDDALPFGLGYYMALVYGYNYPDFNKKGTDLILINDVDGENNLGDFETKTIKFTKENIASFCKNSPIWKNPDAVNTVKITLLLIHKK